MLFPEGDQILQNRTNHPGSTVGGCGHYPPEGGSFFIHRQGKTTRPVQDVSKIIPSIFNGMAPLRIVAVPCTLQQSFIEHRCPSHHPQPAWKITFRTASRIDAIGHHLPDSHHGSPGLRLTSPRLLDRKSVV